MTKTLTSPPVIDVDQLPSAQPVESAFLEYSTKITTLKATAETLVITDESDTRGMKLARETRLALKDIRCAIEAKRKELKEESLRRGQRVDAAAKQMTALIEPLETRMLEQEQFAVRMAAERKDALHRSRFEELRGLGASNFILTTDLGGMADDAYSGLVADTNAAYEARLAREKQERRMAEARARDEAEAREKLRLDNERLRAEVAQREAAAQVERECVEAEARAAQEVYRKEREKAEAFARIEARKATAEREKLEAEHRAAQEKERKRVEEEWARLEAQRKEEREASEAAARKEREAREKVEAELRTKQLAEEATRKAEADAAGKAAAAPDKAKLLAYAESLAKQPRPEMSTDEGWRAMALCESDVLSLYRTIRSRAAEL